LAITEPWAGSDVAGIRATAVRSACGKYYTVNGMKKWITTAVFADFITVGLRTGGAGNKGLSFLVVPRNLPGVTARKMKCSGWWASGTTFLVFENVKVPAENLIGQEGDGFKFIMYNFNHERLVILNTGIRLARNCLHEAMKYAHKRETFGKRLIDHQVIRLKLANMARQVESCQSLVD
jgi:alkylation response protein AidB-like acyl-CoA dehydrogenase